MLQLSIAAACCTIFLISSAAADAAEDERWSRQASSERERRIDDWIPVTDPCPTCKRPLIGEQKPGKPDDISNLLTPPVFGKPRHLPLSNQEAFFPPKGDNSIQFPPNRPFALRQASGSSNFLQQNQQNPFIQEQKSQQFFSPPQQQNFPFQNQQQQQFFIPPQSHFPIPNQPRPQFDFIQPPPVNGRPQTIPPQFNNRLPPKTNTFPGLVTPVQIGGLQNEKEEVQLLYVPVETLQKNKLKDSRTFGKQSSEKGPTFQLSPTSQSIIKDQRFTNGLNDQFNQREPKQNFNAFPSQFGNPSSFQFQQIGDTRFGNVFDQSFRNNGFQSFSQPPAQPPQPPPSFIRNENQNRFEFTQQQSAVPSNEIRQTTPTFNQFVSQTPAPAFTNQVQYTPIPVPTLPPNPPPHQPPLAVYMERNENSKVTDVLSVLKGAKTIPVLDQVEDQSPLVFVGPSSLDPPKGYVKFDLPYLSSLESNRIERKIASLPFFVAPLNFKPPPGYSKVPFPAPHIGSVVISNSTILKETLDKPSTNKITYAFETTQTPLSESSQVTLASSPNFFQDTKFNEISSTTQLPSTFKEFSTPSSFETYQPRFETRRPQFDFNDAQFTRKPTTENVPPFEPQNVRFTQPLPEIKQQFVEKQPDFNINQPQGVTQQQDFASRQPQFVEQTFDDFKQQFNSQPQFTPEQPTVQTQFSAGTPPSDIEKPQFKAAQSQFNAQPKNPQITESSPTVPQFEPKQPQFEPKQPQFEPKQPQFEPKQPQFEPKQPQFEPKQPQFNGQQITYQFEKDQITNNLRQQEFTNQRQPEVTQQREPEYILRQPEFTNLREQEFTNQRQPEFTNQRQPEFTNQREQEFATQPKSPSFEPQSSIESNQPQYNNEQQVQSDYNSQQQSNYYDTQVNQVPAQTNDISPQSQTELTTDTPAQVESTTVYIPRRRTTTPKQQYDTTPKQYKSSTPPPNYNPRRNRKPLYRGIPKNSGDIQSTTVASFNSNYDEPQRPVYSSSEKPQTNQIGTRFEETFTGKFENNYQTITPNKEYQTASETYYQPEIENTVGPVFEQKVTENYPQNEKVETPTTFTQQTPNYSNFQGINQFFNQVIQKETNYIPQERTTEPQTTLAPQVEQSYYTITSNVNEASPIINEPSQSPIFAETVPQTESPTTQQPASVAEQEYTKKPNFSEKRHRYRQKLQNTVNTNENTPSSDNSQKTDAADTEKPIRKNKYRNRQRLGGRGQYRTSTSTETTVDENIPAHFSSIRNQNENANNQVTENFEAQSTSTEHASTKIDVGKYGTFKRRRPIKAYERTSTSTEVSNIENETTIPSVSPTRSYRPRARTTASPGERVTRNRVRRPSTSTTPESTSVAEPTRAEDNASVDWGSYVSSFNPSAQANDVLGTLEDQNKISKTEGNAIDQYSIQRSQSYEITSPTSNSDQSQNFVVTPADQASYSTNDQSSLSQYETRKFSSKKLHSGFSETDNTYQDTSVPNSDSQLDSIDSRNTGYRTEETSNPEDKSILEKATDGKKAYDPTTGKKVGGRRRGQWVRVRVKKPNQEYFETAESQNVANVGNSVQNPTKPSLIRLSSEEFSRLQAENKEPVDSVDQVYFTTERISSTTTEDSPSKFDLEKGVSAMIAEFMNADEDESKDNAQEIFESVDINPSEQSAILKEETSVENQQVSESHSVDSTENTKNTSESGLSQSAQVPSDSRVQSQDTDYNQGSQSDISKEQHVETQNTQAAGYDAVNHFSPVPSEISPFQTQYHENYNEESEQKESQPKEREIKHVVNENSNYEYSNHKYDEKSYVPEAGADENVKEEQKVEEVEEIITHTTSVPEPSTDSRTPESPKANVLTESPEITTSSPDSEGFTGEYDGSITTESSLPRETTHSKVLGTSTTTEISEETEICYKGRCIKSKKKRPVYQDLFGSS